MNLSRAFILRPVATTLLMVALLLSGVLAYRLLPVAALPQVDYPIIQITTLYPGASPELTTRTITAPLERQLGQIPGLKQLSSTSSGGASVITLQFGLEVSLGVAEQDVQAAINAAGSFLPGDLPVPPVYRKVNPADTPILTLAVTSQGLSLPQVHDLVDTRIAQRLAQLPGVGLVSLAGGQRPAVRIQVNPGALAANNLGMDHIRTAIAAANVNLPKGSFDGPIRAVMLDANDQMRSVAEYRALVLAWREGAPLRLGDVATITDGAENRQLAAWSGTTPAVLVNIQRQPGANVIAVVEQVRALLPQLQATLPAGVQMTVLSDRTESIRASVRGVQKELVLAIALVVLVTWVFLRNLPATLIPSVAVPLSLIGTFAVMLLAGYSLNNLTLMALTIATGFVVDDAIVLIENIARYLEEGDPPFKAALKGATQIGFTIISLTVSLIAVLIPLLFMGDVVGRLFREFAVTLAITILISAVVSLTLVPMMSARWLKPQAEEGGRFGASVQRRDGDGPPLGGAAPSGGREPHEVGERGGGFLDRVIARYDVWLQWVLRHQPLTLVVAVATLALTVLLYVVIPKGLFPTQDTGQLQARIEAAQDVSYTRMAELQQQAANAILADPEVASVSSVVGVDAANNTALNTGSMLINMRADRGNQEATMQRLRERVRAVAGVTLYLQPTQDLTIDAETGPTEFRVSLEGVDTNTVDAWAQKLVERLRTEPLVRNPTTNAGAKGLAAYVDIDRNTASRLSVTASSVDDTLYSAFGQRIVSTIFTETNQYRVILEAQREALASPQLLGNLQLRTGGGGATTLSSIATVREQAAPLQVTHVAQYPAATVGFDTADNVALGKSVAAIRAAAKEIGMPASMTMSFLGAAGAYEKSLSNQLWLILAAVVCVYIVLGVLYESYIHPLTILSTLPSAGVGALLALMVTGNDLGVIGIIGIILLIGIVKKNAIMMIDFAIDAERREGKSPQEAIHQAALLRFRPILMTTLAALFAALPLMFGWGEGAELRRPLGLAIFGGLVVSQVLTLFTTPVVYLAFDRMGRRFGRKREAAAA